MFAAFSQLAGSVRTRIEADHSHVEWLRFLKQIDRETSFVLDLHLVANNCATHKHPKVQAWLEKHPRFKMHFTPTSSSSLNLVKRFFADLTDDVIRAGSFTSVNDMVRKIRVSELATSVQAGCQPTSGSGPLWPSTAWMKLRKILRTS